MARQDEVPEADHLEQGEDPTDDEGSAMVETGEMPADAPDVDVYEQSLPTTAGTGPVPFDSERVEPSDDEG